MDSACDLTYKVNTTKAILRVEHPHFTTPPTRYNSGNNRSRKAMRGELTQESLRVFKNHVNEIDLNVPLHKF